MATVTSKLTITSSNLLSHALNLTATHSATATHTTGLSRSAITSTAKATASGQVTLATTGQYTSPNYIFVKNTSTVTTNYVSVFADTAADDPDLFYIPGGGFAVIPLTSGLTLKTYATVSGTVVEWMVFGTEV